MSGYQVNMCISKCTNMSRVASALNIIIKREESHVKLVDAHTKRNGGHDHVGVAPLRPLLVGRHLLLVAQPCVVLARADALIAERSPRLLHLFYRSDVHDPTFTVHVRRPCDEIGDEVVAVTFGEDGVCEVSKCV